MALHPLKVVLASPSDVSEERDIVKTVIDDLNSIAKERGLTLELLRWETDAYPGFHVEGPQEIINDCLKIEQTDIFIGIFWSRFGSPTKKAGSGTEEEIRQAIKTCKKKETPRIMLYFGTSPVPFGEINTRQIDKVKKFKKEYGEKGLFWNYNNKTEFERLLRRHIISFILNTYPNPSNLTKIQSNKNKEDSDIFTVNLSIKDKQIPKKFNRLIESTLIDEVQAFIRYGINNVTEKAYVIPRPNELRFISKIFQEVATTPYFGITKLIPRNFMLQNKNFLEYHSLLCEKNERQFCGDKRFVSIDFEDLKKDIKCVLNNGALDRYLKSDNFENHFKDRCEDNPVNRILNYLIWHAFNGVDLYWVNPKSLERLSKSLKLPTDDAGLWQNRCSILFHDAEYLKKNNPSETWKQRQISILFSGSNSHSKVEQYFQDIMKKKLVKIVNAADYDNIEESDEVARKLLENLKNTFKEKAK